MKLGERTLNMIELFGELFQGLIEAVLKFPKMIQVSFFPDVRLSPSKSHGMLSTNHRALFCKCNTVFPSCLESIPIAIKLLVTVLS